MGTASTWVTNFSKFKLLHKALQSYFVNTLNRPTPALFDQISLSVLTKDRNVVEVVKFLQIVLAAAVLSEKREEYITNIEALDSEAQTALMLSIEEVIGAQSPIERRDRAGEERYGRIEEGFIIKQLEQEKGVLMEEKSVLEQMVDEVQKRNIELEDAIKAKDAVALKSGDSDVTQRLKTENERLQLDVYGHNLVSSGANT